MAYIGVSVTVYNFQITAKMHGPKTISEQHNDINIKKMKDIVFDTWTGNAVSGAIQIADELIREFDHNEDMLWSEVEVHDTIDMTIFGCSSEKV